ncbi:MAG: sugar ABC transporter permease [Sphaerochaetaceae bacterium]|nr:sugar ABC transporter permease [Sphaerochaetaceae bacterium]
MNLTNYHLMNFFEKFIFHLINFFKNLPSALWIFLVKFSKGFIRFFVKLAHDTVDFFLIFKQGDVWTKLSFVFMGLGDIIKKRFLQGFIFLGSEIGFIFFFFQFALKYLKDFGTLGQVVETEYIDEATGIIMYNTADNSMLILLFSVLSLSLIVLFIAFYIISVKDCYKTEKMLKEGKPANNALQTIRSLRDENYHKTLLTFPTVMVVAFTIIPLLFMFLIAFTNYDANHQPPGNLFTWVGFQNIKDVFGGNQLKSHTFFYLLKWDFVWAFFATFSNYFLGMILAIMINKKGIKGKKMWRTIFVVTIAVPQFVSLLMMSKFFGDSGPVNLVLQNMGLNPIRFLTDGKIARRMCVIINMWVGIPYSMLITTGILMNIPSELYESAKIDGAGAVKGFFQITLPYVLFVTTPYLITQYVGNFNNFNVIYLLTTGGPKSLHLYQAGETDLLVTWLYSLTIQYQDYNLASVIGIMCFIVSAVLSLIVYNSSSSVKNEEQFQ